MLCRMSEKLPPCRAFWRPFQDAFVIAPWVMALCLLHQPTIFCAAWPNSVALTAVNNLAPAVFIQPQALDTALMVVFTTAATMPAPRIPQNRPVT
jgi:hypothetical protein